MRIAYFTEWSPYEQSGVLKKLVGQVRAWRELGHEATLFTIGPCRDTPTAGDFAEFGETFGAIGQSSLDRYRFARLGFANKLASVPPVVRRLREYCPDILYYRAQGLWYPGLGTVLGIAPAVLEVNTIEAAEAPRWGKLFALWHGLTGTRTFRLADAMVCVTDEIAQAYAHFGKPMAVIANSLDQTGPSLPPTANARPSFVFVGSATVGAGSWHGIDKIVELARALPDCDFNVVGMRAEDLGVEPPANLRFQGTLHGDALTQVYRRSDVAISTLALHRLGMKEACPLKTREYLMHGLPVILGYHEAEPGLRGVDYVLDIGNSEDNVATSIGAIRAFAEKWCGRRVDADLEFLSSRFKAQQRIQFFEHILKRPG
jgi:hypothetical protein